MRKRRPEPFWRAERSCYFVQIGKRQIRLDTDETEAYRLSHELMAKPPESRVDRPVLSQFVVEVIDAILFRIHSLSLLLATIYIKLLCHLVFAGPLADNRLNSEP